MRIQRTLIMACLLLTIGFVHAATGTIDSIGKYAYSETATWINFAPTDGGVTVTRTGLSGFAWCKGAGWIKLGSDAGGPYANTSATDWGVNVTYSTPVPGGGPILGPCLAAEKALGGVERGQWSDQQGNSGG
ncbi:MAG: hypothetical protein WCT04_01125 [Planctomycetota bacterium]